MLVLRSVGSSTKGYIWTGLREGSCSIFCKLCLDEFHFVNGDFDMWIVSNDKC